MSAQEKGFFYKFFKDVSTLSVGSFFAQLVNLVSYFVFARIFNPDLFGFFGVFVAVYMVLSEVVNWKYDVAVMLPKKEIESIKLYHAAISIGVLIAFAVFVAITISDLMTNIKSDWYLLPILVFVIAFVQPITMWLNRSSKYVSISIARVIQALTNLSVGICLWKCGVDALNILVVAFISGYIVQAIFIITQAKINPTFLFNLDFNLMRTFRKFPQYSTWSSLVNNLSRQLPFFMLQPFFGTHLIGYLTFSLKILQSPFGLFSNAISQVFYRNASTIQEGNQLNKLFNRTFLISFLLGIIPTIVIALLGPSIFDLLFGEKWTMAGKLSQILIAWVFIGFIVQPLSSIIDIKQQLGWELKFNIIFLFVRAGALLIGILVNDFLLAITLVTAVGVVFNLILFLYIKFLVRHE